MWVEVYTLELIRFFFYRMENLKESLKGIKPTYKLSIISCFQFTEAAMNIHLNTVYKQNNYFKRTAMN